MHAFEHSLGGYNLQLTHFHACNVVASYIVILCMHKLYIEGNQDNTQQSI